MSSVNVALVVEGGMKKNRIFDIASARDNVLERFYLLREKLNAEGMTCQTDDMFEPSAINVLIFNDIMNNLGAILRTIKVNPFVKLIYIPNEPSFVIPFHDAKILPKIPVDTVLTWNDLIADKYPHIVKCNIGQPVITKDDIPNIPFDKKQFICSIFAYKPSKASKTLFNERIYAVDFFCRKPAGLDLYGLAWDASGLPFVSSSYKGPCENKKEVQKHYKFSIAYENVGKTPGLITEKIFDCFAAGTVPIYWGAPNIKDYIPSECFVDVNDFDNYEQLYNYLISMPKVEYQQYLHNILQGCNYGFANR